VMDSLSPRWYPAALLGIAAAASGCGGCGDRESHEAASPPEAVATADDAGAADAPFEIHTNDDKLSRFDQVLEALASGDAERYGGFMHAIVRFELADALPTPRPEPAELVATLYRAFPDLEVRRQFEVLGGYDLASVLRIEGTHEGELWGLEPTGRRISLHAGHIAHLTPTGEIGNATIYLDQATLLAQIGELKHPGASTLAEALPELVQVLGERDDGREESLAAFNSVYLQAASTQDADAIANAYAADAVLRDVRLSGELRGKQAIRRHYAAEVRELDSRSVTARNQFSAGEWAVAETLVHGKLRGAQAAPGGRGAPLRRRQLELARIRDGLIVEHWIFSNDLQRAVALGEFDASRLAPPAAQEASAAQVFSEDVSADLAEALRETQGSLAEIPADAGP
jgi:ketosteroid isomerase-like protein